MGDKINITYETLFDILRSEKNRNELQRLDESFFKDLIRYISEKKDLLNNPQTSVFADAEQQKAKKQLESIYKLVSQLYDQREKKIVNMSIISVKTCEMLDNRALLDEEKPLFDALVKLLKGSRKDILDMVLETKQPQVEPKIKEKESVSSNPMIEKKPEKPEKPQKVVRFIKPVPKFVGKQLEVYGPFEEEDVANLPTEIANILISKLRAEEINS